VEKEYASLGKEVKKLIRPDHRRDMNSIASEAQSAADLSNIIGVFDAIKYLTNDSQVSTIPVKTKNGKCITTSEGQLQRWRKFFKEILNSDCPPYKEEEVMHSVPQLQINKKTIREEVIHAIKSM
jgi:hypothetical protein